MKYPFDDLIRMALAEDLGLAGDITSRATIPADQLGKAVLIAKATGVLAGVDVAVRVFQLMDPELSVVSHRKDGDPVAPGDPVLTISGPTRALLGAERVALNFARHLSGVASATRILVDLVEGTKAAIVCTRKTTPGLRALEKQAVRAGGGQNHRFGLFDAVLIKDNHIAAAGGVGLAIRRARASAGHLVKIEVEVSNETMLREAMEESPDVVMLDNMSPEQVRQCVDLIHGRAKVEASGNISRATVRAYAEAGVDLISVGAITHSAPNLDLSLEFLA